MRSVEADDERQSQLLTIGNFRDWHTVVRQILLRLVLETSVDHQSKLIYTRPAPECPASAAQYAVDATVLDHTSWCQ